MQWEIIHETKETMSFNLSLSFTDSDTIINNKIIIMITFCPISTAPEWHWMRGRPMQRLRPSARAGEPDEINKIKTQYIQEKIKTNWTESFKAE